LYVNGFSKCRLLVNDTDLNGPELIEPLES
jgi:hypothetical protein